MNSRPFTQKGFTLLEVLLAITVLSLLMVYVFSIVDSSTTTKETIIAEDREYLQILTAFDRIEMDFSQIFSPLYFTIEEITRTTPGIGIAAELFQNTENKPRYRPSKQFPRVSQKFQRIPMLENETPTSFVFMTNSNRRKVMDSPESRYSWVSYSLRATIVDSDLDIAAGREQTQDLVRATLSRDPYSEDINWDDVRGHVLLKGIKNFRFEFWNKGTQRFVQLLREDQLDPLSPRLMKASFTWVSPEGDEHEFQKTFRPLWPKFDRNKEQGIIIRAMQETVRLKREKDNPGESPAPEPNFDDNGDGDF